MDGFRLIAVDTTGTRFVVDAGSIRPLTEATPDIMDRTATDAN